MTRRMRQSGQPQPINTCVCMSHIYSGVLHIPPHLGSYCLVVIMSAPYNPTGVSDRFREAAKKLHSALSGGLTPKYLQGIKYPDFDNSRSLDENTTELEDVIKNIIQGRQEFKADCSRVRKARSIVRNLFRASYPFATLFLSIARDSSSVLQRKIYQTR